MTTETEFAERIDCSFPYADERAASSIVEEACRLSANACFLVAHELARPPRSADAPSEARLHLLAELRLGFQHPLRELVLNVAESMIRGRDFAVPEALILLQKVAVHRGQYNALNIVYFSCDDANDIVNAEYNRIVTEWTAHSGDCAR